MSPLRIPQLGQLKFEFERREQIVLFIDGVRGKRCKVYRFTAVGSYQHDAHGWRMVLLTFEVCKAARRYGSSPLVRVSAGVFSSLYEA